MSSRKPLPPDTLTSVGRLKLRSLWGKYVELSIHTQIPIDTIKAASRGRGKEPGQALKLRFAPYIPIEDWSRRATRQEIIEEELAYNRALQLAREEKIRLRNEEKLTKQQAREDERDKARLAKQKAVKAKRDERVEKKLARKTAQTQAQELRAKKREDKERRSVETAKTMLPVARKTLETTADGLLRIEEQLKSLERSKAQLTEKLARTDSDAEAKKLPKDLDTLSTRFIRLTERRDHLEARRRSAAARVKRYENILEKIEETGSK